MSRFMFFLILAVLCVPFALNTNAGAQQDPFGMPITMGEGADDELGIEEELDKEAAEEEKVEEKPIPPINMVFVRGGCYEMGDWTGNGDEDERPAHEVCVADFYIQDTEVTQELFEAVMGSNFVKTDPDPQKPVGYVSWFWANRFIERLNAKTGGFYRLPTEAEWEYAARERGRKIRWSGTDDETDLKDYAWFEDNYENEDLSHVKQKKPNALGLYDMSGNAWEWVEDYFAFDYYELSPKEQPFGPDVSYWRVLRGGSIAERPHKLRTTYRYGFVPSLSARTIGLRLAE